MNNTQAAEKATTLSNDQPIGKPAAYLAGGCFWCLESFFRRQEGVLFTRVGYMGGSTESPTYEKIGTGKTGHAETVEITFDPEKISYAKLVELFLTLGHDPTQLNGQGVDFGTQYRSAIFVKETDDKKTVLAMIDKVNQEKKWAKPIVTTIEESNTFWPAEDYHQQYYEKYEKENGVPHVREIFKKMKSAFQ